MIAVHDSVTYIFAVDLMRCVCLVHLGSFECPVEPPSSVVVDRYLEIISLVSIDEWSGSSTDAILSIDVVAMSDTVTYLFGPDGEFDSS